jgi:hypothetical protein
VQNRKVNLARPPGETEKGQLVDLALGNHRGGVAEYRFELSPRAFEIGARPSVGAIRFAGCDSPT